MLLWKFLICKRHVWCIGNNFIFFYEKVKSRNEIWCFYLFFFLNKKWVLLSFHFFTPSLVSFSLLSLLSHFTFSHHLSPKSYSTFSITLLFLLHSTFINYFLTLLSLSHFPTFIPTISLIHISSWFLSQLSHSTISNFWIYFSLHSLAFEYGQILVEFKWVMFS